MKSGLQVKNPKYAYRTDETDPSRGCEDGREGRGGKGEEKE